MSKIEAVLKNNLCIGCGACSVDCSSSIMKINSLGIYQPDTESISQLNEEVCPFTDNVKKLRPRKENEVLNNEYIGNYVRLGAAYSNKFRNTSSSGGIATWSIQKLLDNGSVDGVICVNYDSKGLPEYTIVENIEDLVNSSGTKYYPLTLENILKDIMTNDRKYAFTGVPCFVNAMRLLSEKDDRIKGKVIFYIGIFCGGLKSKSFTEYLAQKSGQNQYKYPKYREKLRDSVSAMDYGFNVTSEDGQVGTIRMKSVGDMWGTGMFKPNPCEYCEDLCGENADLSLGDAWINPYMSEPDGHNIVIVRSDIAENIINDGILNNEISFDEIDENEVCKSQQGNINHRRVGLGYRVFGKESLTKHLKLKPKMPKNLFFCVVIQLRTLVIRKSNYIWRDHPNSDCFDKKMYKYKYVLNISTKINHKIRRVLKTSC